MLDAIRLGRFTFTVFLILLTSCGNSDATAGLGDPVELALGESVSIESEDLSVTFTAVIEDSRCPSDVQCVWEGNAKIKLTLSKLGASDKPVSLNSSKRFETEVSYLNYRIKLLDVSPQRGAVSSHLGQEDYRVTIIILID